jgi:hypothetical protein
MTVTLEKQNSISAIIIGQILLFFFLLFNLIVFYFPQRIVDGTYVLFALSATSAIFTRSGLAGRLSLGTAGSYIFHIYENLLSYTLIMTVCGLLALAWGAAMFTTIYDRFIYVKALQNSLEKAPFDLVSLPDPAMLADAFQRFPRRREVPFLLVRSSRLFISANREDLFRDFQRRFIGDIKLDQFLQKECTAPPTGKSDAIIFLAMTNVEAYANRANSRQSTIQHIRTSIGWLDTCRPARLDSQVYSLKLKDDLNELLPPSEAFDIDAEIAKFDRLTGKASPPELLAFYESHSCQEYYDFLASRKLSSLAAETRQATGTSSFEEILDYYKRVLMLRQAVLRSGEVQWISVPQKLILFHFFMSFSGSDTKMTQKIVEPILKIPEIFNVLKKLVESKAFEEFRVIRGWYAGTPLDQSLNGAALVSLFYSPGGVV